MRFGRTLPGALAVALTLIMAACGGPPPPPPPTMFELTLVASPDLNQGFPVEVRVYQLGSPAAFSEADFFQIYDADQATLGPDLLAREDFTINPGDTLPTLVREMKPGAGFIGVLVAYRDPDRSSWRATVAAPPNETTTLTGALGANSVVLTPGS